MTSRRRQIIIIQLLQLNIITIIIDDDMKVYSVYLVREKLKKKIFVVCILIIY